MSVGQLREERLDRADTALKYRAGLTEAVQEQHTLSTSISDGELPGIFAVSRPSMVLAASRERGQSPNRGGEHEDGDGDAAAVMGDSSGGGASADATLRVRFQIIGNARI